MMNRSERRTVLGGLAAILALRMTRADAAAAVRAGAVETSQGECFARTVSSRRPLTPEAAVFVGDSVGTGIDSSLGLLLGAATIELARDPLRDTPQRDRNSSNGAYVPWNPRIMPRHAAPHSAASCCNIRGTSGMTLRCLSIIVGNDELQ